MKRAVEQMRRKKSELGIKGDKNRQGKQCRMGIGRSINSMLYSSLKNLVFDSH